MPKKRKPLTKEDIERAMRVTLSNKEAARYLRVCYTTYSQYAKMYTDENGKSLFDIHKNQGGVGIIRLRKNYTRSGLSIMDILSGKLTGKLVSPRLIKEKILSEGLKVEQCDRCGFNEKRSIDQKVPIIFNFRDGDKTNWVLDNIEFLCHNCYYINIGDIYMQSQIDSLEFYNSLKSTEIDFELPEQHDQAIKKELNIQNKFLNTKEIDDDYGSDLISYNR